MKKHIKYLMVLTISCFYSAVVDNGGVHRWKLVDCGTFEMGIAAGFRRVHGRDSRSLCIVAVSTRQSKAKNEDC